MKKIKFFMLAVVVVLFTACHDKLWDSIEDLDSRVTKLEELCKEMNTNISALQTIVEVIQENDFITGIVPIEKGGEVIGYTITFGKHEPITIYNGVDGKDGQNGANGVDGKDGYTPILGVAKDTDGVYYWTLDGEWLLDNEGNKIRVTGRDGKDGVDGEDGKDGADGKDGVDGEDGKDGQDGTNGTNGADGKDGVTPQLKIEEGYWYISYDNGATWAELGKAVGEDGKDGVDGENGKDGQDGDSMFTSVTYDDNNVYFTLTDGSVLIVPRGKNSGTGENDPSDIIKFEDLNVKSALLLKNIDTNGDGEISYGEAANYTGSLEINGNNILSFKECQYFTGVTSVSFYGCTNLFEIVLPNSLDTIANNAFKGNTKLVSLILPNSCVFIGEGAFYNCSKLKSIDLINVKTISNDAFRNSDNLVSINMPNVVTIGSSAFFDCNLLSNITIPNSVTSIGNNAFVNCPKMKSFTFPENLVGSFLPSQLYSPDYIETIYWNKMFYSSFYYADNVFTRGVGYCTNSGYTKNKTITKVIFGEKVQNIPEYLCARLTALKEIIIPESVTSIGNSAFEDCESLTEVIIPNNVTYIGERAFASTSLKSITLGEGIVSIGRYAFLNCDLENVYCKAIIPPTLVGIPFDFKDSSGVIYVPKASIGAYITAWSDLANRIVGYDF
ncbi:MAG: leucine-rich repeat protein [Paludibacteraceae bacterium]|nr:leucine-rich repeat protein [Paludibacteraceae bacterium]